MTDTLKGLKEAEQTIIARIDLYQDQSMLLDELEADLTAKIVEFTNRLKSLPAEKTSSFPKDTEELTKKYSKEIQAILNKPVVIRCGRFGYQHKTLNNEYFGKFTDYGNAPDKWQIYPISNGHLIIKSLKDGKNLQAMPSGATRCENQNEKAWEWFNIEFIKDEFYIVSQHTKKVL